MIRRLIKFRPFQKTFPIYNIFDNKGRHEQINESFQEHKKNSWKKFGDTKQQVLSKENMQNQQKVLEQTFQTYLVDEKFTQEFDQDAFIELISQISYSYANKQLIESEDFQKLVEKTADKSYLFTNVRFFTLFFSFCSTQQIKSPQVWQNFWGYLQNYHHKLDTEQKLLILDSISKIKSTQFVEFYILFEDQFLKLLQDEKLPMKTVLNILQVYQDKGQISFQLTIRLFIINKIPDLKIVDIIQFLLHYSNTTYDSLEDRKLVIDTIQSHLYKIMQFLNIKELTQVFFCFVKTGFGTDVLYRMIEQRVILIMPDMSLKELERFLIIAANKQQILKSIFSGAENLFINKISQTKPQDMVQILYLFVEHNQGSKEFMGELERHLYPSMYSVPIEDLGDLVWSMLNIMKTQEQWLNRVVDVVDKRIDEMQLKQLTQFIWLLSDHYKRLKNPEISKFPSLFHKISVKLMKHFQKTEEVTIKDSALVLSAYVQNYPIPAYLVDLIFVHLIDQTKESLEENIEPWELSTILWGFQYIDNYDKLNVEVLFDHLFDVTVERIDEMNMYETLNSLRAYILTNNENEDSSMMVKGIEKTLENVNLMTELEQIYFAVFVFTRTIFQGLKDQDNLIEMLLQRAETLKSDTNVLVVDELDGQVNEFLLNEEVNKYK